MYTSVRQVLTNFNQKIVLYDESFQRRTVWLPKLNGAPFIESLSRGWAKQTSKIVVVDARKSLRLAKELGNEPSAKYFQSVLDRGFEYISVDGQNRTKFIEAFFNNSYAISGIFQDADGEKRVIENKYFKDFPIRVRDALLDSQVDIEEMVVESAQDLAKIFSNANMGVPLNDQEKRNATLSEIAKIVRRISRKDLCEVMNKVVKSSDLVRMGDDELTAKMLMTLLDSSFGLDPKDVNDFYEKGTGFYTVKDQSFPYSQKDLTRAENILSRWKMTLSSQKTYGKTVLARRTVWAVLFACAWSYDNNYYVTDYDSFYKAIKAADDYLSTVDENLYSQERMEKIKAGEDPDDVKKGSFYHQWRTVPHHAKARNRRISKLVEYFTGRESQMSLFLFGADENNQILEPLECESLG